MPPHFVACVEQRLYVGHSNGKRQEPIVDQIVVVFRSRHEHSKTIRVHPPDQLLLSLGDRHQRSVTWTVVLAPMARDDHVQRERGDDTSAVRCEYLFEEVNHFNLLLRFTGD